MLAAGKPDEPLFAAEARRLTAENAVLHEALFLLADDESGELARFMSADLRRVISAVRNVFGLPTAHHDAALRDAKAEYARMMHGYPDQSGSAAHSLRRLEGSALSVREAEKNAADWLLNTHPGLHAAALKHASNDGRVRPLDFTGRETFDVKKRRMEMAASRRQLHEMAREKDAVETARDKLFEQVRHHVTEAARGVAALDKEERASVEKRRRLTATAEDDFH